MRAVRTSVYLVLTSMLCLLPACGGGEQPDMTALNEGDVVDGFEEFAQELTNIGDCAFDAFTGAVTLQLEQNDVAIISKNTGASPKIKVNGFECGAGRKLREIPCIPTDLENIKRGLPRSRKAPRRCGRGGFVPRLTRNPGQTRGRPSALEPANASGGQEVPPRGSLHSSAFTRLLSRSMR